MESLFMKYFSASLLVLCKHHLLIQRGAVLKVEADMGRRSRTFIRDNCYQDLLENKENIKEFAMVKNNKKKKSLKNNVSAEDVKNSKKNENIEEKKQKIVSSIPKTVGSIEEQKLVKLSSKVLKKQGSLSKNIKSAKSIISHNSTQNTKSELRKQHSSEIKPGTTSHTSPITKHPVVLLHKIPYFDEESSSTASNVTLDDATDVTLKDPGKACSSQNKSKNDFPKCECHSNLLLKEAVIVLERFDNFQNNSTAALKDNENVKELPNKSGKGTKQNRETKNKNKVKNSSVSTESKEQKFSDVTTLDFNIFAMPDCCVMLNSIDGKCKEVPNKSGKGTKRKKEEKSKKEDKSSSESTKSKKQKVSNESKSSKKEKIPDVTALDFNNDSKSPTGKSWNFKISSWNINGLRAWLEKNGLSYLHHEQPDILCIQETKCSDDKLPDEVKEIEGYHTYWLSADKDGYSGVGLITKEKPIKVEYGIGISEHDNEGRVITAEYDKFYLVSTYVPNAGRGLVRLDYRMKWDKDFREYLKKLDAEKPIILTGDLNVAHEEIDLANPKTNKKNAGFTKEEREGFSTLLEQGYRDTFRHLYPSVTGAYTFWTYMMNARAKNVGWRLDYFVMSERFTENLCDNVIRKDVYGSDHCPITLFLSL